MSVYVSYYMLWRTSHSNIIFCCLNGFLKQSHHYWYVGKHLYPGSLFAAGILLPEPSLSYLKYMKKRGLTEEMDVWFCCLSNSSTSNLSWVTQPRQGHCAWQPGTGNSLLSSLLFSAKRLKQRHKDGCQGDQSRIYQNHEGENVKYNTKWKVDPFWYTHNPGLRLLSVHSKGFCCRHTSDSSCTDNHKDIMNY